MTCYEEDFCYMCDEGDGDFWQEAAEKLRKENEALSAKIEDLERENARLRENFGSLAELIEDDNR